MIQRDERELLRFASRVAGYERPRASAALRSGLRSSLLSAPVAPRGAPRASWLVRLRPLFAAFVLTIVLVGTAIPAAAASLPGEPAFALKRAAEEAVVAITFEDAARLDTFITLSDRRLGELVQASASRPDALAAAAAEYLAALDRLTRQLNAVAAQPATAGRAAALARAVVASEAHVAQLQALVPQLPAAAQPGIQRAIDVQQTVHTKTGPEVTPRSPATPAPATAPARTSDVPGGAPPGRGGPPSTTPSRR